MALVWAAVGLSCFWLSGPLTSIVSAQERGVTYSLSWVRDEGAESCIAGARLGRALEELVGPILRSASEAERSLEGFVRRVPGTARWQVRLRVFAQDGRELGVRELEREASDCAALDRAILLVAALAVAPDDAALPLAIERLTLEQEPGATLLKELEEHPPVVASPPSPIVATDPARSGPPTLERAAPTLIGEIALAGAGSYGLLPDLRPGARLSARLRTRWGLSAALALHAWARSTVDSYEGARVTFRAADATLSGCAAPSSGRFTLDLCVGATSGARWVRTEGSHRALNPTRAYWGPSLTAELSYRFASRWFLQLSLTGLALWPRDRFTYVDASGRSFAVFEPSRFAGSLALGAGVAL